jgi:hypothetical protein
MQYWGVGRLGTTQNAAYTGTAGTITNGVGQGIQKVRVVCTTDAFVAIGTSPTATTSDAYVVAFSPEYFTCAPGSKVSAVQVSTGGTVYVTEIS